MACADLPALGTGSLFALSFSRAWHRLLVFLVVLPRFFVKLRLVQTLSCICCDWLYLSDFFNFTVVFTTITETVLFVKILFLCDNLKLHLS